MYRLARSSITMLFVVVAAACQSATKPETGLASARARWAARGPDSYAVTVTHLCECLPEVSGPVRVTVRNKTVESRVYTSSGTAVAAQYASAFPSVEELFALIDGALRRGDSNVEAQYHPTLGYPTRFADGDPAVDAPLWVLSDFEAR